MHIEEREAYMIWLSREAYQTRLSERYNLQEISHSLMIHTTESPTLYITATCALSESPQKTLEYIRYMWHHMALSTTKEL